MASKKHWEKMQQRNVISERAERVNVAGLQRNN
jgi:hypothetical protein